MVPGLLLVGPTGVGKTPLGEYAEAHGFRGRRCTHFDFGASLRKVDAAGTPVGTLKNTDVDFIHKVLTEGALLENETFYIAAELLSSHIAAEGIGPDGCVLLNGLPRHVDQARGVASIVQVERVLHLHCSPEMVYERIHSNCGGDRTDRTDDAPEAIAHKLQIFEDRTRPLVEHYRSTGVPVIDVAVTIDSVPAAIWAAFEAADQD
jgi:adenylate kinase